MAHRVCPWWLGYLLASPIRKLTQDPQKILAPWVRPGMTVLEPGPGMGFFTLELGRLVGSQGRVVAVDVQPRMLASLRRRAVRAGLESRIELRQAHEAALGIEDLAGRVDFVLAFAVVHEMPDAARFFADVARALKPVGKMLLAEPASHVRAEQFAATLGEAERAGLRRESQPPIWRSHSAVLVKA